LKIASITRAAAFSISLSIAAVAAYPDTLYFAKANLILTSAQAQEPSPEEKMRRRFPQPAKVSHLIGLPVLDGQDRTLGYVENVVRSPEGKVRLIVPFSSWLGWPRHVGPLSGFRRPVAVPIEVVAILGLHINAIDMDRPEFEKAPTWTSNGDASIPRDETISIALGKR
jgi:hypothetical protein